jgi:hypothetical protein
MIFCIWLETLHERSDRDIPSFSSIPEIYSKIVGYIGASSEATYVSSDSM